MRRHSSAAKRRRWSLGTLCIALVALLFVGAAPAAAGQIVWSKGGEIWTMRDDGYAPRVLVPLSAAPGMTDLRDPAVHPGGAVVTFEGSTNANRVTHSGLCGTFPMTYPCTTFHFGFWGTGAYRWSAGQTSRLSPAPAYCWNCSDGADEPEPRPDGSVVFTFMHCQGFMESIYTCESAIQTTSGESYPSCSDVESAAPSPTNPSEVAYTGCWSGGSPVVVVSGPARAGERVIGCDDAVASGPAWSPDGTKIVTSEIGVEPGLWMYSSAGGTCSDSLGYILTLPSGSTFSSPHFLGADRLVFEADGDLWTVPVTCDECVFPQDATRLTTTGDNHEPTWTADPLNVASPGGGGAPGGGGGGGGGGGNVPTADATGPVGSTQGTDKSQRVGRSKRLTLKITTSEPATASISGTISVPGRDPKLAPAPQSLAAGAKQVVKVKLGTKAVTALRKAWARRAAPKAKLAISLRDGAGNTTALAVRVTLRR